MKKVVLIMVTVLALVSLVGCQTKSVPTSKNQETANLTIKFDNKTEKVFKNIPISKSETAMSLLQSKAKVTESGGFITAIDSHSQSTTDKIYWMFNVNGKEASKGAGSTTLKNKDSVEFYLQKY